MFHKITLSRNIFNTARGRRFAAATSPLNDVHAAALSRLSKLKKTYPGIFDVNKFSIDQASHIKAAWSGNAELVKKWNARAVDMQDRGVRFHYEIGGEKQIEALPEFQPPVQLPTKPEPLTCPEKNWANLKLKLAAGQKLVKELDWLKDHKETPFDGKASEINLKLIEAHYTCEHIDDWMVKLEQEQDEWRGVAVPVTMQEYTEWIAEWKKTCEKVGSQEFGSSTSHLVKWEKLSQEESTALKEHFMKREEAFLKEVVQAKDPSITREKWFEWKSVLEEMFQSKDMEHYSWNDYSKDLFRAAVWQSKERVAALEKEFDRLTDIIKKDRASEVDIKRCAYEKYPDLKFRPEASQELEARDPLVVAKLLLQIKQRIEESLVKKSVKEILSPYMNNLHEAERLGLQRNLDKWKDSEEKVAEQSRMETGGTYTEYVWNEHEEIRRSIKKLEVDIAEFNAEVVDVQELADELVPKMCWQLPNDKRAKLIDTFKKNVVVYCQGKGSLQALTKEFFALMPHNQGEAFSDKVNVAPDDHDHVFLFCKINEVRDTVPQYWSVGELLEYDYWDVSGYTFSDEGKLKNIHLLHQKLEAYNIDPLLLNLTKVLIEDKNCGQLEQIHEDYHNCVSKFNGELHGVLRSAEPLTKPQYNEILAALQKANPSKKFFLSQEVDPALLAGFVVKCGVQTLDFSLLGEIEAFKNPRLDESKNKEADLAL